MRTKMILPVQDETTLAIENLSAQVIALRSQLESAERERDAAIAKLAAVEKDAERYRWLRDVDPDEEVFGQIVDNTAGENWDAAIDAARGTP